MDVSIIIVNYNTKSMTKACLESIVRHTEGLEYEIILIDNASTDKSDSTFEKYSTIKYIRNARNWGFGKANNIGLKYASGKYIFLLNSDTLLVNNAIKIFFDTLETKSDKIACLGCPLLENDGESIGTSYGKFPDIKDFIKFFTHKITKKKQGCIDLRNLNSAINVDYIIGADLFIRKKVIEQIGLFDDDFFMYFEETEMQYRYTKAGYEMQLIPGPKIIHLAPNQIGKPTTINRYLFFEGMFTYFKKRYGLFKYLLCRILSFVYISTTLTSRGTISQRIKFLLLLFGIKLIKH